MFPIYVKVQRNKGRERLLGVGANANQVLTAKFLVREGNCPRTAATVQMHVNPDGKAVLIVEIAGENSSFTTHEFEVT